jgi:hypothetical protein
MPDQRLPRTRRVAPSRRPPFRLEDRDTRIVQAVHDYRALTAEQIQRLFFTSMPRAQTRLQKLFHHEYLNRQTITALDHQAMNTPILYTIGKRGVQLLLEVSGYELENISRPVRQFSLQFADHLKRINDFRIAIVKGAEQEQFTLETWHDERYFRAATDFVSWVDRRDREHTRPVLPDGYFCLRVPQGKTHCFLEIDRSYQPHSIFRPKITVYEAYVASGQYQERFSKTSLRVLIVTSGEKRLQNLMRVTEKAGGDEKYWFTTFAQVTPEQVLTVPIWHVLGEEQLQPLIDPV